MLNEKYDNKLPELKELYQKNPNKYKRKVFLIILLGYGFFFGIMALCAFFSLFIITILSRSGNLYYGVILSSPFIFIFIFLLLSIFINFKYKGELLVNAKMYPKLFSVIKEINKSLSVKLHKVYLCSFVNAAVSTKRSLFRKTNILYLGFPLLMFYTEAEFKSLLGHELAHLSSQHNRFNNYVYRLNIRLNRMYFSLQTTNKVYFLIRKFLAFYYPLFTYYSYFIVRENERNADEYATLLTNGETTKTQLIKLHCLNVILNKYFFKDIFNIAKNESVVINDVYHRMYQFIKEQIDESMLNQVLEKIINYKTAYFDTHPSLEERLNAIGSNQYKYCFEEDLFQKYFDNKDDILNFFNNQFKIFITPTWNNLYHETKIKKTRLQYLENVESPTFLQTLEKGMLIEDVKGVDEAIKLYQDILIEKPDYLPALFSLGRALLKNDDAQGLVYIEKVINKDIRYINEGYQHLYDYYYNNQDFNMVIKYNFKHFEFNRLYRLAINERKRLTFRDILIPHNLSITDTNRIKEEFSTYPLVSKVYLARKKVRFFTEYSLYVIGIKFKDIKKEKEKILINQLANNITLPGEFIIISLKDERIVKKFTNFQDSMFM